MKDYELATIVHGPSVVIEVGLSNGRRAGKDAFRGALILGGAHRVNAS